MEAIQREFIKLRDGAELYTKVLDNGHKQWLIATHGVGEHLHRHDYLEEVLGEHFNIFRYDLRGHGRSSGKRGHVDDFCLFAEDLSEIIQTLKSKQGMSEYVLFGHSMGALITAQYIQQYAKKDFYPKRIFLSAPPVGMPGPLGKIVKSIPLNAVEFLANLEPSIALGKLVDLNYLSHNLKVRDDYKEDELNLSKLHTKLLLGLIHTSREVFSKPLNPHAPLYIACGSDDGIVNFSDLEEFFQDVEKKCILQEIEGGYHELHNEVAKYREPYIKFLTESLIKK